MKILEDEGGPVDKKERQVGGMPYKPIELRPLGPLRAENQEENVGELYFKILKKYFTQQGLQLVLSQV